MSDWEDRLQMLESEIERRLGERFAGLRDEFDRLRIETDRRWEGFLSRFDQNFRGIVPTELVAPPPVETTPSVAPTSGALGIAAARSLDDASNQVDALHRFLDLCRERASRVALLVTRTGAVGVWKAVGFSDHGGDDEAVRRLVLPLEPGDLLSQVLEGRLLSLTGANEISSRFAGAKMVTAILVPMVVKEKISGAVYADAVAGEQELFDPEAIAFLTYLAGLTVDRLASRKLRPAPALKRPEPAASPESVPAKEHTDSYETMMSVEPAPAEAPRPTPPPPPPAPVEPEPEPELIEIDDSITAARKPTPAPPPSMEPPPPLAPAASTPVSPRASAPEMVEPESRRGGAARPPDFSAAPSARPTTGARRLAGPLAPVEGDERRDEARRFAKLLVSEIKLYNERAVLEGREHGNLYERLKEDIDRSRQMYDDRIPEDVRANSNFFYEELVRVLADGRAEALGMGS
jgi:hypothetical protein